MTVATLGVRLPEMCRILSRSSYWLYWKLLYQRPERTPEGTNGAGIEIGCKSAWWRKQSQVPKRCVVILNTDERKLRYDKPVTSRCNDCERMSTLHILSYWKSVFKYTCNKIFLRWDRPQSSLVELRTGRSTDHVYKQQTTVTHHITPWWWRQRRPPKRLNTAKDWQGRLYDIES